MRRRCAPCGGGRRWPLLRRAHRGRRRVPRRGLHVAGKPGVVAGGAVLALLRRQVGGPGRKHHGHALEVRRRARRRHRAPAARGRRRAWPAAGEPGRLRGGWPERHGVEQQRRPHSAALPARHGPHRVVQPGRRVERRHRRCRRHRGRRRVRRGAAELAERPHSRWRRAAVLRPAVRAAVPQRCLAGSGLREDAPACHQHLLSEVSLQWERGSSGLAERRLEAERPGALGRRQAVRGAHRLRRAPLFTSLERIPIPKIDTPKGDDNLIPCTTPPRAT